MPLIDATGTGPDLDAALDAAAAALAAGGVVGIPTDTVYGLAAAPQVEGATAAVFALKGRPEGAALPVLVAGLDQAATVGDMEGAAGALAAQLWPGGLTLVVPRRPGIAWDLGGDAATIGLRCPDHEVARELCRRCGPLVATSANRHGEPALAGASEVVDSFPGLVVLEGGECRGVASTVVDLTGGEPRLLRAGAVPWEDVQAALAVGGWGP
ncbi:MAG TPA: L-threonylcarbamoyladenylate synthase [Acidimicrobiales bacterium]|nr:L-threonylcarbamoyladenylate synthase [Acidimicrobiales bacterium]